MGIPTTAYSILQMVHGAFVPDMSRYGPAVFLGYHFAWAIEIHQWRYCTRCHGANYMVLRLAKIYADNELKWNLIAFLPWYARWIGWVWRFLCWKRGAFKQFDKCDTSDYTCIHGMLSPKWMRP